jgi:acetyl esterase
MKSPKLDPAARSVLEVMEAGGLPPIEQLSPAEARGNREGMRALAGDAVPVAQVEDIEIAGLGGPLKLRIYTPDAVGSPHPCLLFFHGGGFVICDLDTHDNICRALAAGSRAVVIAVDYRLAPEHKFPAAVEDCEAATRWVAANSARLKIDPSLIAVGGDSAGGNLATVVARRLRDSDGPSLALQILIYPVTDVRISDTPSMSEFSEDNFLTRPAMQWFMAHYLNQPLEASHPDASPLLAQDLKGLPPALVITAECDPLCSEGQAYAERLKEAAVPVNYICYPGMIHAFVSMRAAFPQSQQAIAEMASALRAMRPAMSASHA